MCHVRSHFYWPRKCTCVLALRIPQFLTQLLNKLSRTRNNATDAMQVYANKTRYAKIYNSLSLSES